MPLAALLFSASCGVAYALPMLCALEPLRGTSGGATMTTPVGRAHSTYRYDSLRARRTGFSHMVGAPPHTGLRPLRYPGGGADTASGGGGKVPGGTIGWIVTVLVIIVVVYLIVQLVL